MLVDQTVEAFLDKLASEAPTPGGGSAAALAGAAASSLIAMVVELTLRSDKQADSRDALFPLRERTQALRRELTALVDRDAESYDAVVAASRMPKGTPEEKAARAKARGQAIRLATETPLRTAERAGDLLLCAVEALAAGINPNAASDLGAAVLLAHAALEAAAMNVEINLPGLKDDSLASRVRDRIRVLREDGENRAGSMIVQVWKLLSGAA